MAISTDDGQLNQESEAFANGESPHEKNIAWQFRTLYCGMPVLLKIRVAGSAWGVNDQAGTKGQTKVFTISRLSF
jgi:hypothetical protein